MLEFESPYFLLLLLLLAPLAWRTIGRPMRRSASIQFSDVRLFLSTPSGGMLTWRRFLPMARLIALALLIVALARPRFGTVERDVVKEGVDLFYCLDISGSMRSEDFVPNRMEKAKELTAEFASRRKTDRQGIVLFAGEAFTLCPLTYDNNTIREFLKNITFDDIGVQGTAIGMGLSRALKKLQTSKAKSKVIILMTDGVNNTGTITPAQATAAAKSMGVKVYTVGIGSRGWAYATVPTQMGMQRVRIQSDLDEELLRQIADQTGGTYHRATTGSELADILREIDRLEKSEVEIKEYRSFDERMGGLCWVALALLMLEMLLANTRFLKIP